MPISRPTNAADSLRPEADAPDNMQDIEIFIDRLEDGLVVGTNNGVDVPVGTVFRVVEKSRADGDTPDPETFDSWTLAQVNLRLSEVLVFRKSIDVMPHGYSAGLRLDGEGFDALCGVFQKKRTTEIAWLRITSKSSPSN
ncbi:hypothetical protein ACFPPF_16380 [Xenophilus aerolatus]|nr:hypothetical protein [Xenophilus aerolatus]